MGKSGKQLRSLLVIREKLVGVVIVLDNITQLVSIMTKLTCTLTLLLM